MVVRHLRIPAVRPRLKYQVFRRKLHHLWRSHRTLRIGPRLQIAFHAFGSLRWGLWQRAPGCVPRKPVRWTSTESTSPAPIRMPLRRNAVPPPRASAASRKLRPEPRPAGRFHRPRSWSPTLPCGPRPRALRQPRATASRSRRTALPAGLQWSWSSVAECASPGQERSAPGRSQGTARPRRVHPAPSAGLLRVHNRAKISQGSSWSFQVRAQPIAPRRLEQSLNPA